MKIRREQLRALNEATRTRRRREAISEMIAQLREKIPDSVAKYSPSQQAIRVGEVLDACQKLGISDPGYAFQWSLITIISDVRFYDSEQFAYVLGHPFLHPDAKARHIILAFSAIQRMAQEYR